MPGDTARLLAPEVTTLANGLSVITQRHVPGPLAAAQLWYHVGSKDDPPDRPGLAHLFEHGMFFGTDRVAYDEVFQHLLRAGAVSDCGAYTTYDQTVYHALLPSNQLDLLLWLEAERLGFLKIDQAVLDRERKVVRDEKIGRFSDPDFAKLTRLRTSQFQVHPYRWSPIGRPWDLRAVAAAELRAFWETYYIPNNAALVVAGDVDHERVVALAEKRLGWLPRGGEPPRVTVREPEPDGPRSVKLIEPSAQSMGMLSWLTPPAGHADESALQVLERLTNLMLWERFFKPSRWRTFFGIGSPPRAAYAEFRAMEQAGVFELVGIGWPNMQTSRGLLKEMERILNRIRLGRFAGDELDRARVLELSARAEELGTAAGKAKHLGWWGAILKEIGRAGRVMDDLRAVTAADVVRVAQQYLDPKVRLRLEFGVPFWPKSLSKQEAEEVPVFVPLEDEAPPPGRVGAVRPEAWEEKAPRAPLSDGPLGLPLTLHVLSNGLRLVVGYDPGSSRFSAGLTFGSGDVHGIRPGADTLAMELLGAATARRDGQALRQHCQRNGLSIHSAVDDAVAYLHVQGLAEQAREALDVLGELVESPPFPAGAVAEMRKGLVKGHRRMYKQPGARANTAMAVAALGDYARRLIGYAEPWMFKGLTAESAREWWRDWARPNLAVGFVAGPIEPSRAVEWAERALAGWKPSGPDPLDLPPELPAPRPTSITILPAAPNYFTEIRMACRGIPWSDPRVMAGMVLNDYFSGFTVSRVRETVCYRRQAAATAFGGLFRLPRAGMVTAGATCYTSHAGEAVTALIDELRRLRTEPPTEEEFEKAKAGVLAEVTGNAQGVISATLGVALGMARGLDFNFVEETAMQLAALVPESCRELARSIVDVNHLRIIVTGPVAALRPELGRIAPIEIGK